MPPRPLSSHAPGVGGSQLRTLQRHRVPSPQRQIASAAAAVQLLADALGEVPICG